MLNNVNSLIRSQLERLVAERKLKDADVLKRCGFTRPTLAKIKNEGNITIETLAALANGLGVRVSYFFDEEEVDVNMAGRDYVQRGNIIHKGTEINAPVSVTMSDLEKENSELKRQLIEAQAKIISLIEQRDSQK